MAQNIYDNPEFFAGYRRLPRQVHGLDGAPEWAAIRSILPDVKGRRVADLGCGFGWASRWFHEQGAAAVFGVDLSKNMIEQARSASEKADIDYRIADLETLELPAARFDLVYSSLTFHYVQDFGRLVRMTHRALAEGGDFVFTIEHPIYMAARHPMWMEDRDGRQTWPVDSYALEGERRTDWFTTGVQKYHRTLATTLNTLIAAGFTIRKVDEFAPTPEQAGAAPELAKELERPMILIIWAQKS